MPDNIQKLGNYRYRPTTPGSKYHTLPNAFDPYDSGNYYTNATNTITPNTKESFTVDQAALKINTTNVVI
jgi:hypothetical protein